MLLLLLVLEVVVKIDRSSKAVVILGVAPDVHAGLPCLTLLAPSTPASTFVPSFSAQGATPPAGVSSKSHLKWRWQWSRKMTGDFNHDAAAEAAGIALKIGSAAVDAVSFMADLGEELPVVEPVLKTLKAIREKVESVKQNREDLGSLEERCTYVAACVIVKCRKHAISDVDVTPLVDCIEAARKFMDRCSRRGRVSRILSASGDKDEIARLNARVDRVTGDLGLAGIAILNRKVDDMNELLVSCA